MSTYTAEILWSRGDQVFTDNRYSRKHLIRFDCGIEIDASASPHVVRPPFSSVDAVDPEEAFVASLSSCHMLTFLGMAARRKFRVDSYRDLAEGVLEKNDRGKMAMTVVTLRPEVRFSGDVVPTHEDLEELHHRAHEECFISNSVLTEVRCEWK